MKSATADFQRHNDIPALFAEECCLIGPDYKTQANTLYQTYKKWCEDSGHKPMSSTSLAGEWERLGFEKYAAAGRRYYRGVGLLLESEKVAGLGQLREGVIRYLSATNFLRFQRGNKEYKNS